MEEKLDKIIELLTKIETNTRSYNGYAKWTQEQEELVDIMYNQGHDVPTIITAIKEKFNIERTTGAITSRISSIGLKPISKRKADTSSLDKPVRSSFKKKTMEETIVDDIYDGAPF